jgi:hypothetical protein
LRATSTAQVWLKHNRPRLHGSHTASLVPCGRSIPLSAHTAAVWCSQTALRCHCHRTEVYGLRLSVHESAVSHLHESHGMERVCMQPVVVLILTVHRWPGAAARDPAVLSCDRSHGQLLQVTRPTTLSSSAVSVRERVPCSQDPLCGRACVCVCVRCLAQPGACAAPTSQPP